MKPISLDVKNRIKKYLEDGISNRKTAEKCRVSCFTVNKVAKQLYPAGRPIKYGQPNKLTDRDKEFCVRQMTLGGKENAVEVQKALKDDLNISVCANTVRKALNEKGLVPFVKPKKPHLSPKNIKSRLAWAKEHAHWTMDDWRRVIWSDESKIDRFGSDGKIYGWKRASEQLQTKHVKQTVKHGGGNLKIWSCITFEGVGLIVHIEQNLTKEIYKFILEEDLKDSMEWYQLDPMEVIFQHDNDPKHTAKLVTKWLGKQNFGVLDWPSQSPDLNPIENMWSLLKKRLYSEYNHPPKGMVEHWERVWSTWYKISKEECQKVISTMPKRCMDVIKAKGLWINY